MCIFGLESPLQRRRKETARAKDGEATRSVSETALLSAPQAILGWRQIHRPVSAPSESSPNARVCWGWGTLRHLPLCPLFEERQHPRPPRQGPLSLPSGWPRPVEPWEVCPGFSCFPLRLHPPPGSQACRGLTGWGPQGMAAPAPHRADPGTCSQGPGAPHWLQEGLPDCVS